MAMLSTEQRATLTAVVDTAVPALPAPTGGLSSFWTTPGSGAGVVEAVESLVSESAADASALGQLLDVLRGFGFEHQGRATREAMLGTLRALSPEVAVAVDGLRSAACMLAHSLVDGEGRNPFWAQYGYPGPAARPPDQDPGIEPYRPQPDETMTADVVVVGSGAGGGLIAGVLAEQGMRVVVLESGGLVPPRAYRQREFEARQMLYKGGVGPTADGNVALLAGATLGGGTTVNWQNCYEPSRAVRQEWARDFGLDDIATDAFDRHIAAVVARIKGTTECSDLNGPHQRMAEGARQLGWSTHVVMRNVDRDLYDPTMAGYCQFGDPTMSKMSTLATYLQDAYDAGARILVHTRGQRVLVDGQGHAIGVEAVHTDPTTQESQPVTIHAPVVVVACGALETPALLLRSRIGGPAVGRNLYLHPAVSMLGTYEGWTSLRPRGVGDDLPPWEQVAAQVTLLERTIERAAARLGPERVLPVRYERLCADPAGVLGEVRDLMGRQGPAPDLRPGAVTPFAEQRNAALDAEFGDRIYSARARYAESPPA